MFQLTVFTGRLFQDGMWHHVESDRNLPIFLGEILCLNLQGVYESRMFFRNVPEFIPDYTVSHTEGSNADSRHFLTIKPLSTNAF